MVTIKEKIVHQGFTLVEVTVVIAVLAITMITVSGIFAAVQRNWQIQRTDLDLILNSRWAIEFMSNEIRQATANSLSVSNNGNQLNFSFDPEGDGLPPFQSVQYIRSGPVLGRNSTNQILCNFLADNPNGNALFQWDPAIGLLSIELTVTSNNRNYALRTQVRPRN